MRTLGQYALHAYALAGDLAGVKRALGAGADVNEPMEDGRTALVCAIGGEDWHTVDPSSASFMTPDRLQIIESLVSHPDATMFTLNAAQAHLKGVTALGLAAWLNMLKVVEILLDASDGAVAVDGRDGHNATPLMYAARDGSLDVCKFLLEHGARPDLRDSNHRSCIQFSVGDQPQILWMTEMSLRRHRHQQLQAAMRATTRPQNDHLVAVSTAFVERNGGPLEPPALSQFVPKCTRRLTDALVCAIVSSDIPTVMSLLFPEDDGLAYSPLLVNQPDHDGWSPIHHCVSSTLSLDILDALYLAGADVSLFTPSEQFSPLHLLALSQELPDDPELLYNFTLHLIRDLRVPLSATDRLEETPIHVAAEHGASEILLSIFLECDPTGSIRDMRNARGLTALDVARPEFRSAFGVDMEGRRAASSLSCRTVRPLRSVASSSSVMTVSSSFPLPVTSDDDMFALSTQLLSNLTQLTRPMSKRATRDVDQQRALLGETARLGRVLLPRLRTRCTDTVREVHELRALFDKVDQSFFAVSRAVAAAMRERGIERKKRNRESEDSQATAVEHAQLAMSEKSMSPSPTKEVEAAKPSKPSKFKAWLKRKIRADRPTTPTDPARTSSPFPRAASSEDLPPTREPMACALMVSSAILDAVGRDMHRIVDALTAAQKYVDQATHSISRAERVVGRCLRRRSDLLAQGTSPAEMPSVYSPNALRSWSSSNSLASSVLSVQTSSSASPNASSASSIAETLIEDDDEEDVRLLRRLLFRKVEVGLEGAAEELQRVGEWLCIIKDSVRAVKHRTCV
ncbi:ankyrin repeat-containing domain protein [Schizophyllum amplum]|uniref:Ankyrin repeat-containing domain protein n=1 Tax=Schizophyllum amplum TaxID=97359 RepID=A0A550CHI5_9AGAR|nr:ankyrin repeat-containing domain protein [Auriculariopsis ampla]